MLQFSALNKNQLPELLTANLTFMETPQNVTKSITEIFFFLPDILYLSQKLTAEATSKRTKLQQVHMIKITSISRERGKLLGLGGGAQGASQGCPPSAQVTAPSPPVGLEVSAPVPSSNTSLPSPTSDYATTDNRTF